jgi:sec-independent protein translocase protein TatA
MMSPAHWVIVALIVVLLFGSSKLGEVGKGLGEGIRSFKKGVSDTLDDAPGPEAKQIPVATSDTKDA